MTFERGQDCAGGPDASDPYEPAVFINWIDLDADEWDGVWQDGTEHRGLTGTKREVQEWAARQQAVHYWIYDGSEFVAWDLGTAGRAG